MAVHRITKGLDLPITGLPEPTIDDSKRVNTVAVIAHDIIGLKPRMKAQVGDDVRRGTPLFEHRKRPGLIFTSPAAGKVVEVHRGERRALQSFVIALSEGEKAGEPESTPFSSYTGKPAAELSEDDVRGLLLESGLWAALRERPFSTIPAPESKPGAIFVNATDSNPGAPKMELVFDGRTEDLEAGLLALSKLTEGTVFFVRDAGSKVDPGPTQGAIKVEEFEGKHPYGTVGTHIHNLWPVNRERVAWHLNLQDALRIGVLIRTGELDPTLIVSLTGPQVNKPRLLKTRLGAPISELVEGELKDGENRIIAGSVLSGRQTTDETNDFLGRYDQQISVIREGREREFLGWLGPGTEKFSVINTFVSKLMPTKRFDFTTTTHGSHRAMVPIGMYEKVMPLDIMPTFLLRALAVGDVERAEALGALELDEEDLALCTFVDPGKTEYGPLLRGVLTTIQEEG